MYNDNIKMYITEMWYENINLIDLTQFGVQYPTQWVPGAVSLGVKRPRREADYSPQPSAEIKECAELYLHSPNTSSWRGA